MTILCDLDGTLFNANGRVHPILGPVLKAIDGAVTVRFLTARIAHPERRRETLRQLALAGFTAPDLVMRPVSAAMFEPHEWKIPMLTDAALVIDDDAEVLAAAARMGIPALHPFDGLVNATVVRERW